MRRILFVSLLMLGGIPQVQKSWAQESDSLKHKRALAYYQEEKYENAYNLFLELYDAGYKRPIMAYNLGIMTEDGTGTSKDLSQALDYYEESANLGFAEAQNQLGYLLMYSDESGFSEVLKKKHKGADPYNMALRWLRLSAKQNNGRGYYLLATFYLGEGCLHSFYPPVSPYDLFQKSAELGYFWGKFHAGYDAYCCGDYDKAISWLREVDTADPTAWLYGVSAKQLLTICFYMKDYSQYLPWSIQETCGGGSWFTMKYRDGIAFGAQKKDNHQGAILFMSMDGQISSRMPFIYDNCSGVDDEGYFDLDIRDEEDMIKWSGYVDINGQEKPTK